MNGLPTILIFVVFLLPLRSEPHSAYDELEDALGKRAFYLERKERRIDSLKARLSPAMSRTERMAVYDRLYEEYLTYSFDSVMAYVDRAGVLLGEDAGYEAVSRVKIHRAQALATSGHFSQAVELLSTIDPTLLTGVSRQELYVAFEWAYGVWAQYSGGSAYAPDYRKRSVLYLDSLLSVTERGTPEYNYYMGDCLRRKKDYAAARDSYRAALDAVDMGRRLYAQAAYGLAVTYRALGERGLYRKWLVNAAISDQVIPLKENLALQQLAMEIKNEDGDLERANRYLKYSLEDAMFYNNRLRLLEISEKFPAITLQYQDTVAVQNRRLRVYLILIGVLMAGLVLALWLLVVQKRRMAHSRQSLSLLNEELKSLNVKLAQTNGLREQYVSLFMDLCAAYIDKLKRFQSVVTLKVKARQFDDLLRVAGNGARLSEAELKELFFNFDSAFLRLYPDFINQFNSLLRPDMAIVPKKNELLNTDLRIFALIRMGITDSNKIATLLFYSPQTIFNHRTQVRNRAIDRDNFEKQLMEICVLVPEG